LRVIKARAPDRANLRRMTTRTPLADPGPDTRTPRLARASVGLALALVGGFALVALIYLSNSRAPAAERAMIDLGLAGSVLVSAIAQAMVVVGLWMVWRATRKARP
jgi:hypothetical protein